MSDIEFSPKGDDKVVDNAMTLIQRPPAPLPPLPADTCESISISDVSNSVSPLNFMQFYFIMAIAV